MTEKSSFRRGNKRGMRFKPSGGLNRRSDRSGLKARANVETIETPQDEIYNTKQHEKEIVRAENQAHGLPPDTDTDSAKAPRKKEPKASPGPSPAAAAAMAQMRARVDATWLVRYAISAREAWFKVNFNTDSDVVVGHFKIFSAAPAKYE